MHSHAQSWPPDRPAAPSRLGSAELALRCLIFAIPLGWGVYVDVAGAIYLPELALLGLLPILLLRRGRALGEPLVIAILALGALYLAAQVATDLVRESPFQNYIRGWSRILVLLGNFVALYLLIGNRSERLLLFAIGALLGGLFGSLVIDPEPPTWKFGYARPVTDIVLLLCVLLPFLNRPRSLLTPLLIAGLGALSIGLNYRSWGGILLLTAAYLSVPAAQRLAGSRPRPLSAVSLAVFAAALVIMGFGTLKLYAHAASEGWLGALAQQKYETQAALGDVGLILGGRNEMLVSVQAIRDSPLLGHGSWADDAYYARMKALLLYKLGFVDRYIEPDEYLIPTHSHILGAWVEAGIGGAVFWLGVLVLVVRALARLYASEERLRPYLIFCLIIFLWDLAFSPFGAQRRLSNAYLLTLVLYALRATAELRRRPMVAAPAERPPLVAALPFAPAPPALAGELAEPSLEAWPTRQRQDEPSAGERELRAGFQRLRQRCR